MQSGLKVWEILVPTKSDGKTFALGYHHAWDEKILQIAGGLTIFNEVDGKYVFRDGKTINEKMVAVRVACDEKQLKQIVEITKEHYRQETVFVMLISPCAYIL